MQRQGYPSARTGVGRQHGAAGADFVPFGDGVVIDPGWWVRSPSITAHGDGQAKQSPNIKAGRSRCRLRPGVRQSQALVNHRRWSITGVGQSQALGNHRRWAITGVGQSRASVNRGRRSIAGVGQSRASVVQGRQSIAGVDCPQAMVIRDNGRFDLNYIHFDVDEAQPFTPNDASMIEPG